MPRSPLASIGVLETQLEIGGHWVGCVKKFGDSVVAASWDSVIFDVGRESLQRVPTLDPHRGTKAHVGALLDNSDSAQDLVAALTGS